MAREPQRSRVAHSSSIMRPWQAAWCVRNGAECGAIAAAAHALMRGDLLPCSSCTITLACVGTEGRRLPDLPPALSLLGAYFGRGPDPTTAGYTPPWRRPKELWLESVGDDELIGGLRGSHGGDRAAGAAQGAAAGEPRCAEMRREEPRGAERGAEMSRAAAAGEGRARLRRLRLLHYG